VHAELAKVDPATAARLHRPTRSACSARSKSIASPAARCRPCSPKARKQKPAFDFVSIGLLPSDRSVLHARIAERYDAMLKAGLEDEVTMLRKKYTLSLDLPSMRCVGYRQVWEVQDGLAAARRDARPRHLRHAPARQAPDHLDDEHAIGAMIAFSHDSASRLACSKVFRTCTATSSKKRCVSCDFS
jgi:tRNA A37 N6-isopentenylltransferase MiaA